MGIANLVCIRSEECDGVVQEPEKTLCPVGSPDVSESERHSGWQIQGPEGSIVKEGALGIVRCHSESGVLDGGR